MKYRENWENLANAVVVLAYEDLVNGIEAILKLKKMTL